MVRSSGIPRGRGFMGITRIIASRASPTSVTRVSTTTGDLDQTVESTTEHIEDLWVFVPDERSVQALAGDRSYGDLGCLAIEPENNTVDIQKGDRITHGGVEYEVDTIEGRPDDDDPDYWSISLVRRQ